MREKLIELLEEAHNAIPREYIDDESKTIRDCFAAEADHLLANGVIVLPKDGVLFHIEENENGKWVGNKPIQDIVFKCGWGLASLEWSFSQIGKTVFLTHEEAEAALKEAEG